MAKDFSVVLASVIAVVAIMGLVVMYGNGTTGAVSALSDMKCPPGQVLSTMQCDPGGMCYYERHCEPVSATTSFKSSENLE